MTGFTTVNRFRRRMVTIYHISNGTVRKETYDEVTEREIKAIGG